MMTDDTKRNKYDGHTPGPWTYQYDDDAQTGIIRGEDDGWILTVDNPYEVFIVEKPKQAQS